MPRVAHAIERHHTVTHLLHWALHEVVSKDATQKGSSVTPDKLTFDFNSAALTPQQLSDIERLVNERIVENASVSWNESRPTPKPRPTAASLQLFGEKYGEHRPCRADRWQSPRARWLQHGTLRRHAHARTGEIGLFRLVSEAARRRRRAPYRSHRRPRSLQRRPRRCRLACKLLLRQGQRARRCRSLEKKIEALLSASTRTLEKALKAAQQREASGRAKDLLSRSANNAIIVNLGDVSMPTTPWP